MAPMSFRGIPADAFDFFEELASDNTKAWWTENKDRYRTNVREPVEALLAELGGEFGRTSKIFRPYRDTRFSKDKTPYKTNLGATLTDQHGAVWYFALSPEGMYAGGGMYMLDKEQLLRLRAAVADDTTGSELAALVMQVEKGGYEVRGEELKRVPKPYDADHPRARFLRHKRLYLGKQLEPAAWMGTKKAAARVATIWRGMQPIQAWLRTNVRVSIAPSD